MVEIKIDFELDDDFIRMFHRACQHEYTIVEDGKLTLEQAHELLLETQKTKVFSEQPRLGFLKIYDDGELIGLSMPRKIFKRERLVWCLPDDRTYYRMGMVFIDEPFRGMGFGREAARLFKGLYDNILWTIDPTNEASKKVAAYIGLTHKATLYLKDRSWKHTPWGHDRELEIWSN